jgi:hypothetical protein
MVFRSFVLLRCTCLSCRLFWVLFPRSLPSFLFFCLCLSLLCSISPAFFFCCFSALSLFILSILHSSLAFFSACVNLSVLSLFFRLPSSPFCFSSPSLFSAFALPPLSLSVSSSSPLSFFFSLSLSPSLPLSLSPLLFSSPLSSLSPPPYLSLPLSLLSRLMFTFLEIPQTATNHHGATTIVARTLAPSAPPSPPAPSADVAELRSEVASMGSKLTEVISYLQQHCQQQQQQQEQEEEE